MNNRAFNHLTVYSHSPIGQAEGARPLQRKQRPNGYSQTSEGCREEWRPL